MIERKRTRLRSSRVVLSQGTQRLDAQGGAEVGECAPGKSLVVGACEVQCFGGIVRPKTLRGAVQQLVLQGKIR